MGQILSEPMKKLVEIPKILAEKSVEDAKFPQNALTGPAHRPGEKGGGGEHKNTSAVFSQKKTFFRESLVFLAALPPSAQWAGERAGQEAGACPPRGCSRPFLIIFLFYIIKFRELKWLD
jgi:hypothetical protein